MSERVCLTGVGILDCIGGLVALFFGFSLWAHSTGYIATYLLSVAGIYVFKAALFFVCDDGWKEHFEWVCDS